MSEKLGKETFYEDVEVVINVPYNTPIKQVFDSINFDIKAYHHNGEKPFIKARYKTKETTTHQASKESSVEVVL